MIETDIKTATQVLERPFVTVSAEYCGTHDIDELLHKSEHIDRLNDSCRGGYTFKVEPNLDLQVGDLVLVHSRNEVEIVQIKEIHATPKLPNSDKINYKWVLCKLDLSNYKARLKEQEQIAELLKQLALAEQKENLKQRLQSASQENDKIKTLLQDFKKSLDWLN
ncbi:MAG: hypothetical protein KGV51_02925 [Moraxellaceae bacterium]|nr:hypothetical protein [Moraxellaceae bacterium]